MAYTRFGRLALSARKPRAGNKTARRSLLRAWQRRTPPPAGWLVHVKTFDAEYTPVVTRHFYVAEPDRMRAEEIAAELGETAEAIHPLSQRDLDELQKKEHDWCS